MKVSSTPGRIGSFVSMITMLVATLTPPAVAQGAGAEAPGLRPGDAIRLSFWREPELSGEYAVDETGTVVLPLIGRRSVLGVPPADLKRKLADEYSEQLRNQDVQITPLRRVRVLGEVQNPGLYHVDATMTLADVVAMAGGVSQLGTLEGIRIQRQGETVLADLRLDDPVEEQVRSGDQIMIPKRSWLSRYGTWLVGSALAAAAIYVAAERNRR